MTPQTTGHQATLELESAALPDYSLRDYQQAVIDQLDFSLGRGTKRLLLQMPTGAGKTIVAAQIIRRAVENGQRVLFVAHRRELVLQCSDKLAALGVEHGLIMAGERKTLLPDVQVCSIQTLSARIKRGVVTPPPANLVVFDEAHHNLARTHLDLIDRYSGATMIGLTATPVRTDGRGLGAVYESLILGPSISELTEQGHLVPVEYFAPSKPDLDGLRIRSGDYAEEELANRMDRPQLVGDLVENWGRICPDRPTVVFSTGVRHSLHIRDRFRDAGIAAEHIDGSTPKPERDQILKNLADGKTQVVSNCMVLTEGWDSPSVSCCLLARPTKSLGLFLQMAGRILRPSPGKHNAIILDHAGAVYEHGFVDQDFPWALEPGEKIRDRLAKREKRESAPMVCGSCAFVFEKRPDCPKCGWKPERKGKQFEVIDGNLNRVSRTGETVASTAFTQEEKRRILSELIFIGLQRGYKPSWAGFKFRDRFGNWPVFRNVRPLQPNPDTLAWVRRSNREYAKKLATPGA